MKIERAKADYPLPEPIGEIVTAVIDEGVEQMRGARYALMEMSAEDLMQRRDAASAKNGGQTVLARPVAYALAGHESRTILLFPAPDKDADLVVRFYPPMRVL